MEQSISLLVPELKSNICAETTSGSNTDTSCFQSDSDNNDNSSKVPPKEGMIHFQISKDPFSNNYIWEQTSYTLNEIKLPSRIPSSSDYTISHSLESRADISSSNSQSQNLKKRKGSNAHYTNVQFFALEKTFQMNQYPSKIKRSLLAKELSLTEHKVNMWFTNRRTKAKKENTVEKNAYTCNIHTDLTHSVSLSENELAQVSNKIIKIEETKQLKKPDTSIAGRLLQEDSARPTVSPSPASLTTPSEPIPKLPEWYPSLYPLPYPTFNHFLPNSWSTGYYGHGLYRPNDYGYYDMGLPVQYPPFDYRNVLY